MQKKLYRILSIDPGSSYTGITILDMNINGNIVIIFVETIDAGKMLRLYQDIIHVYGERYARIIIIANQITKLLQIYNPDLVVSESPFQNTSRPNAYGALVETITAIKTAVFSYNPTLPFELIEPSVVKNSVGVKGNSGDKELMKKAVLDLNLSYDTYLKPILFDEHSIDSIAIGYAMCNKLNAL